MNLDPILLPLAMLHQNLATSHLDAPTTFLAVRTYPALLGNLHGTCVDRDADGSLVAAAAVATAVAAFAEGVAATAEVVAAA